MEDYVFVYGSLMRGFEPHENLGVSERAEFLGQAHVQGTLYSFGDYPGLVRSETGTVEGELYRPTDPKLVDDLDHYENYYPDAVEESLFVRTYVEVVDRDLQAWAYVYNEDETQGVEIESGSWREYLEEHVEPEERAEGTGASEEVPPDGTSEDFVR